MILGKQMDMMADNQGDFVVHIFRYSGGAVPMNVAMRAFGALSRSPLTFKPLRLVK